MGRPSVISTEVAAALARQPPGMTLEGLRRALAADGHKVSTPTLSRWRKRQKAYRGYTDPEPEPELTDLERQTSQALAGGDLAALRATRDGVRRAIAGFLVRAEHEPGAVRALGGLTRMHRELARDLVDLDPPPPPPPEVRFEPVALAAHAELMARAQASAGSDHAEVQRLRERVAAQAAALEALADEDEDS